MTHSIKKRMAGRGFTLIEMLIGIGLFSSLLVVIAGSFYYLVGFQGDIDSKQQVLSDFRSSVDVAAREIASGSAFPAGCEDGCTNIVFTSKARADLPQRNIEYRYNSALKTLEKAEQKSYGLCKDLPFDERCYQPVVSDNMSIDSASFYIANKAELTQPVITMEVRGTIFPGTSKEEPFSISSSVTPRATQDLNAVPPSDNVAPDVDITSPPMDISTPSSNAILGGSASDNVGVTAVTWRNEATQASGSATGLTSWSATIGLMPGASNRIVIEAEDAEGNVGTDSVLITSLQDSAGMSPPTLSVFQRCNRTLVEFSGGCLPSPADRIFYYKCDGICTPTEDNTFAGHSGACYSGYDWNAYPLPVGQTFSYRARAYDYQTGQYSGWSNVVTYTVQPTSVCAPPPPPPPPPWWMPPTPPPPTPPSTSFILNPAPSIIRARVTGTTTVLRRSSSATIYASSVNGFSGNVTLSLTSGAPDGTTATFNPVTVEADSGNGSTFFVYIPDNTPVGSYTMNIRGVDDAGAVVSNSSIILDVAPTVGGEN